MDSPRQLRSPFRLTEWAILIATVGILFSLAVPADHDHFARAKLIQMVSNGKQIAILANTMGEDGLVTKDPRLGWPGDLAARTDAYKIVTLGDYVDRLIEYDYIKRGDVGTVFGGWGVPPWDGNGQFTAAHSGLKIFKVTKDDGANVVFAESRNYTYNHPLDAQAKPFGDTYFVVTRKDGSSTSYQKPQYNLWSQIGTLTGRPPNAKTPAAEDPSMLLPSP